MRIRRRSAAAERAPASSNSTHLTQHQLPLRKERFSVLGAPCMCRYEPRALALFSMHTFTFTARGPCTAIDYLRSRTRDAALVNFTSFQLAKRHVHRHRPAMRELTSLSRSGAKSNPTSVVMFKFLFLGADRASRRAGGREVMYKYTYVIYV